MVSTFNEYQLQLVFQTFEKDPQLSVHKAIRLYNILYSILSIRINSVFIYIIIIANSQKLTALKEKVIMEDITNRLLAIYDAIYIGLYWVSNFVKQQLELYIYWNRPYDYQKAQYEDPKIIRV